MGCTGDCCSSPSLLSLSEASPCTASSILPFLTRLPDTFFLLLASSFCLGSAPSTLSFPFLLYPYLSSSLFSPTVSLSPVICPSFSPLNFAFPLQFIPKLLAPHSPSIPLLPPFPPSKLPPWILDLIGLPTPFPGAPSLPPMPPLLGWDEMRSWPRWRSESWPLSWC